MITTAGSIIPPIKTETLSVSSELFRVSEGFSFFCIQSGELKAVFRTESASYLSGDLFCLCPGMECRLSPVQESRLIVTELESGFVLDQLKDAVFLFCDTVHNPDQEYLPIRNILLALADLEKENSGSAALMRASLVLKLLSVLAASPGFFSYSFPGGQGSPRLQALASYIEEHYAEPVTLTSLAEAFYLTPQYLSTFFQKHFGTSFKKYLDRKRLMHAEFDLKHSSLSVSETALKNGFASPAAFRRIFAGEYGQSPVSYREEYHKKEQTLRMPAEITVRETSSPSGQTDLHPEQILSLHSRLFTDQPLHYLKNTECMVNTGSAHSLLSEAFRIRLLRFCTSRKAEYVRMMEVVSNSLVPMTLPDYDYYYQNLDTALVFLYNNGLTPMIELSRIPIQNAFQGADRKSFSYAHRNARYFRLLENILIHLSRRFPDHWLRKWKFELCFSPSDSVKSYTEDFIKIRSLLDRYLPGSSLGGPGYDAGAWTIDLKDLLQALQGMEKPPDFFSVYLHCQTEEEIVSGALSYRVFPDADHPVKVCRDTKEILRQYFPGLPLFVTEWTSVYAESLPVTGSRFQAAFYTRTLLELEQFCDLSSYWLYGSQHRNRSLTDTQAPVFDEGLTDSSGNPSACCFAGDFCSRMGRELLAQGRYYRLVQKSEGHFQLITWNYAHFAPGAELSPLDSSDFDKVYTLFEDIPSMDVHFTLEHLPPGMYLVRREKLDEFHGSFLDILIGEFLHSNIRKPDFIRHALLPAQFSPTQQAACVPEVRDVVIRTEGTLQLQTVLSPHDVCLWDIRKLV